MKAYLKSIGSVSGFGEITKTPEYDTNIHKYVFTCDSGRIYFDSVNDRQVKGIKLITDLTQDILSS